ncbi:MAG: flagellar protein FlaG [Steroidobacteraceae bacterium]
MQATQPVNATSTSAAPVAAQVPAAPAADVKAVQPVAAIQMQPRSGRDLQQTLADVAEHLRQYLQSTARDLEFQVDADSHQTVIIVRDASGSVIRQIPGEEALRLQQRLNEGSSTFLDLFV